jgi:hypothetical protein
MKRMLIVVTLIAFLLLTIQAVQAAAPAAYTLDWWTVDSGGGTSQGGSYSLSGTVGQAEPGLLNGGDYSLAGGFWAALRAALEKLSLPLVFKP